ncbi:MAG: nicotinate-nucleotide adenylyltransferase [Bacteroidales bacterium]|nr:nicotinate-nucleotide adenylyltransferase [Bacteroidales bacterium]
MKTGLFFGSFNPIHYGHLTIANFMLNNTAIEELWFVVSPHNPFKEKNVLLDQLQRFKMVEMAINNSKNIKASDVEFFLPQPSYTVDTLFFLKEQYPDRMFYLIMGSDGVNLFHRWKGYEQIQNNFKRFVYPRTNSEIVNKKNMVNAELIIAPMIEISSSNIREMIAKDQDVSPFMPKNVFEYINKMGFYK